MRELRFLCDACNRRNDRVDGELYCRRCGEALKALQELYTLTVAAFPHLKKEPPGRAFARVVCFAMDKVPESNPTVKEAIKKKFIDGATQTPERGPLEEGVF